MVTVSGIVRVVKVAPVKAPATMVVTVLGMISEETCLPVKAPSANEVTLYPNKLERITLLSPTAVTFIAPLSIV